MRVSGWLYWLQQTACGVCLLAVLGRMAGLGRCYPARLTGTAALAAMGCLGAAVRPGAQVLVLPMLLLAPLGAWPGIPRRMKGRIVLMQGLLTVLLAGMNRLLAPWPWNPSLRLLAACGGLMLAPGLMRRTSAVRCVSVAIRHGARRMTLTALVDSGNLLRDPLTGLPVIVISRRAAARVLPHGPDRLTPGMRLMRVRTVAGTTLMTVFRPAALQLSGGGAWRACSAVIGLNPDRYEGFQALVPLELLQQLDAAQEKNMKEEATL